MQARWSALAGLGAWLVALAWIQPPLEVALLLLGPLVAAPLVLGLAHPGGPRANLEGRWKVALALQLPAALCVAVSFALPVGGQAAAWTLPWMAFAVLLVGLAFLRFLEHGFRPAAEIAVDAGLAYLLVGAFWLTFSRWGQPFLGYAEPIEFLTAAHFHFAGLALPVLGGLASRALPGRFSAAIALGLVAGMPLVAAGISTQRYGIEWVNVFGVAWITVAAVGLIVLQARLALRPGPASPRFLWGLSAAALPVGMTLASLYASGRIGGPVQLTVEQMVRTHAVVNVFGFALPALVAWTLAGAPEAAPGMQILLPWLGDRVRHAAWAARPPDPALTQRMPRDNEDRYEVELGHEPPGPPVPAGVFRRAVDEVMAFRVFPARRLHADLARTPMLEGDTVAAAYRALPGMAIAFGARVTQVFDGPSGNGWRAGFHHETLAGHPECGAETFSVEKDAAGNVRLVVTAWSRPGTPLSRLLAPWVRRQQVRIASRSFKEFGARICEG